MNFFKSLSASQVVYYTLIGKREDYYVKLLTVAVVLGLRIFIEIQGYALVVSLASDKRNSKLCVSTLSN